MADDTKKLEERLAALEVRLGLPKMAAASKMAVEAADKRRTLLNPKRTAATTELCREIKALAGEKGRLVEFTMWDIDPAGHMAACCCCCCCCD